MEWTAQDKTCGKCPSVREFRQGALAARNHRRQEEIRQGAGRTQRVGIGQPKRPERNPAWQDGEREGQPITPGGQQGEKTHAAG